MKIISLNTHTPFQAKIKSYSSFLICFLYPPLFSPNHSSWKQGAPTETSPSLSHLDSAKPPSHPMAVPSRSLHGDTEQRTFCLALQCKKSPQQELPAPSPSWNSDRSRIPEQLTDSSAPELGTTTDRCLSWKPPCVVTGSLGEADLACQESFKKDRGKAKAWLETKCFAKPR